MDHNLHLQKALEFNLDEQLQREEQIWRQKSKELYLYHVNMNSKFFHLSTVVRQWRNIIAQICLSDDEWINDRDANHAIGEYCVNSFEMLFASDSPLFSADLDSLIHREITDEENVKLVALAYSEEILSVVRSMHPLKSPRPDGFPGVYTEEHCNMVGQDVIGAV